MCMHAAFYGLELKGKEGVRIREILCALFVRLPQERCGGPVEGVGKMVEEKPKKP